MPVACLPEDQLRRYGRATAAPAPLPLARYLHCDDRDPQLMAPRRPAPTRWGGAGPLGPGRFWGPGLAAPTDVPTQVVPSVAQHLGMGAPTGLTPSRPRDPQWDQAAEMQRA